MFAWKVCAEAVTNASPAKIWDIWADVSSWPHWDHDLEWARLDGPFDVGSSGKLKPKGFFASCFKITVLERERRVCDETSLPFTKIVFDHVLIHKDGKTRIEHHVKVCGLLAPLLYCTMRRQLLKGLPEAVNRLVKLAESK